MLVLLLALFQITMPTPAKAALTEFDFKCSVYGAREEGDSQIWVRGYRDVFRLVVKDGIVTILRGDLHGSHEVVGEQINWHVVTKDEPMEYIKAKTRADYPFTLSKYAEKADTSDRWTTGFKFQLDGSDAVAFLTSSNRSNSDEIQMYSGDLFFTNGIKLQDGATVFNIRLGFCFSK